ncbi:chaperone protein dnaJ C76, chloroplastic-like [Durio zibethinus]|uniref:Chaperone protein dnaJ C76, chloroplastic-like n=1 Tax=Durio zibethinus TaxID=66656 RepID=A0A6P5XCE3_DURZI|nr:chaperone protein dnaJ C76, chloroplastic-like [Durio zibethinus]
MAIILNEVYSVLSDPRSPVAYDKEQAELRRYTGKPLLSVWLGSENEQREAYVDEVKCVGCLKCALFAGKKGGNSLPQHAHSTCFGIISRMYIPLYYILAYIY